MKSKILYLMKLGALICLLIVTNILNSSLAPFNHKLGAWYCSNYAKPGADSFRCGVAFTIYSTVICGIVGIGGGPLWYAASLACGAAIGF